LKAATEVISESLSLRDAETGASQSARKETAGEWHR
jgi:hypothetical protein